MSIPYQDIIHPLDKKAMDALKAVSFFDVAVKKFMSILGERQYLIKTTSSYLELGPNQLPEIYNLLVRVCKRLGIENIPKLYLKLDRSPNAGTFGDTEIFIVINSGLLETMTLNQIETIIAHECGHILCHHHLYTTMGMYIMNGADMLVSGPITATVVASLQLAFYYWMRCSEFSADRVSGFYYGSPEPVIDVMLALAGGTSNLRLELNRDAFLKQAEQYKALIDNSAYNKVLEFIDYAQKDHPLCAYRAYEINEFFKKLAIKRLEGGEGSELALLLDDNSEYTVSIRYEYIKPKELLKLGGIFDIQPLEVIVGDKRYEVGKNTTKNIVLKCGKQELQFSNSHRTRPHTIYLKYDMTLVVTWDCNEEKMEIKEEI